MRYRKLSFWKSKFEKVKTIPEKGLHTILKLSYDELSDETMKSIFLDIVFFFHGHDKEDAVRIFKSCGFYPEIGIPILVDKCLLTIENNTLGMHNLIRDMGMKVIRQESNKLGKRKRLSCESLTYQEGATAIEGLILDLTRWEKKHSSANLFERMPNLRLLQINNAPRDFEITFKNSFEELRYLRWDKCPWKTLPSDFHPQKLVCLDMTFSNFRTLWEGPRPLVNLKSMNVSCSNGLKITPDFSNATMLEKLSFQGCVNLNNVHESIGKLCNLGHLSFHGCSNLIHLPEQFGDLISLKKLDASYTSIEQLPDTICQLKELNVLRLQGCLNLRSLPEQIGNMEGLRKFDVSCSAIRQLPDSFEGLINLVYLKLCHCKNLTTLPKNICKLCSLEVLNLDGCSNLDCLPEQLGKMQSLKEIRACDTAIEELPNSIGQLSRLEILDLNGSEKLRNMPDSIWNLTSLRDLKLSQLVTCQNLPDSVKNIKKLRWLSLRCNMRSCLPMILCFSSLESLSLTDLGECSSSTKLLSLSKLSNLQILTLLNCTSLGSSFPELPSSLRWLTVGDYASLKQFPDLSSFIHLIILSIRKCNSLQSLPLLPPHLVQLHINDCTSLRHLADLATLKDLIYLRVTDCSNLKFIVEESFSQLLKYSPFQADVIPTRELPNWLSNKRNGCKVSFDVPPMFSPDNLLGTVIWIVYRCQSYKSFTMRAVITNITDGDTHSHILDYLRVDGVGSSMTCLYQNLNLVKYSLGDRIEVSLEQVKYSRGEYVKVSGTDIKVETCEIHLIYKPISADSASSSSTMTSN